MSWIIVLIVLVPQIIALIIFWPGVLQLDDLIGLIGIDNGEPTLWRSLTLQYVMYPFFKMSMPWAYGLIQIAIITICSILSIRMLKLNGIISTRGSIILSVVYGLSPLYLAYGLLWSSDVIFARIHDAIDNMPYCSNKNKSLIANNKWIMIIVTSTIMCVLLRKNAIIIPIIVGLSLILLYKKSYLKRIILITIIPILAFTSSTLAYSLYTMKIPTQQEAIAIPAITTAASAHYQTVPNDVKDLITRNKISLGQWGKLYIPGNADQPKVIMASQKYSNKELLLIWMKILIESPKASFAAWWSIVKSYIIPPIDSNVNLKDVDHGNIYNNHIAFDFFPENNWIVCLLGVKYYTANDTNRIIGDKPTSGQNKLSSIMNHIAKSRTMRLIFFNGSIPFWVMILAFITSIWKRNKTNFLIIIMPFLYILLSLFLFSPMGLLRYALELMWCIPVITAWIIYLISSTRKDN
jgi:hypothetical protein